jgi:hypothetical protein
MIICRACHKQCVTHAGYQQHLNRRPLCARTLAQTSLNRSRSPEARLAFPLSPREVVLEATRALQAQRDARARAEDARARAEEARAKAEQDEAALVQQEETRRRALRRERDERAILPQEQPTHNQQAEINDTDDVLPGELSTVTTLATYNKQSAVSQFKKYSDHAIHNFEPLDKAQAAGVQLMKLLGKVGAPLSSYNAVYEWHIQNMEANYMVTRTNLLNTLEKKYDRKGSKPRLKKCYLPCVDKVIKLVVHDAAAQLKAILTHPSIKDEDYNFINGDPFAAPPEEWITIGDINTGRAFQATYKTI